MGTRCAAAACSLCCGRFVERSSAFPRLLLSSLRAHVTFISRGSNPSSLCLPPASLLSIQYSSDPTVWQITLRGHTRRLSSSSSSLHRLLAASASSQLVGCVRESAHTPEGVLHVASRMLQTGWIAWAATVCTSIGKVGAFSAAKQRTPARKRLIVFYLSVCACGLQVRRWTALCVVPSWTV